MRPREAFAPDKAHYVSLTLDEILGSAGVSLEDAFGADPNHLPPPALQFPPLRLSGSTVTVHVNYYEASDGELPIPLPEPCPLLESSRAESTQRGDARYASDYKKKRTTWSKTGSVAVIYFQAPGPPGAERTGQRTLPP